MATVTPTYSWPVPTSTDYVKDGATAIEALGDAVDSTLTTALGGAYPGLRLIKTQAVGTGVSTVTVTNAFSAAYKDYKVIYSGGTASTTATLSCSLGGITTGYYSSLIFSQFSTTTVASANNANQSVWAWAGGGTTSLANAEFQIFNPFETKPKWGQSIYLQATTTGQNGACSWYNLSTASATDLVLLPATGTITGGTIYVYGYGAS